MRKIGVLVAALGMLAAACSSPESSTRSITDAGRLTRIDIPADWQYYSNDALADIVSTPFVSQAPGFEMPVMSRFVFDAAPIPTTDNLIAPLSQADFPIGSSVVRRISPDMRDQMSRYLLAEAVAPYHAASEQRELAKSDIDLGDDYQGVQVTVIFKEPGTELDVGVHLISVTDPEVTMLYQVAIGCSMECFRAYGPTIREVVDSWLVNTRG
ncbi:MAG: hypothetical protein BMS9Abin07_0116 [Acidimicrobiia bacterium]|nr:MAG: hypothetical protein BMS9Abin07_0116 [Acidimicrobiia bacterium]